MLKTYMEIQVLYFFYLNNYLFYLFLFKKIIKIEDNEEIDLER